VEPFTGEWQRHVAAGGARGIRVNVSFPALNRNKRSIAFDLKDPEGYKIALELVRSGGVFLQNYRPGVANRLGLDYETVRTVNPRIVYVSISGCGESGPYVDRPGQDLLVQGLSGAMRSAGRDTDPPLPAPMYIADAITAYSAFEAALAGLMHRERTGEGQLITVNMLDAIIAMQMQEMSIFTVGGKPQRRTAEPHAHCYIRAPYSAFRTADGYVILAFRPLKKLGDLLAIAELETMDDETDGHERRDEIYRLVASRLRERSTNEWLELFRANDVWAGPVHSYADVVADPQVAENGSLVTYTHPTEGEVTTPGFPMRFTRTPAQVRLGAPVAGQHTEEILAELNVPKERVAELLARGVVAVSSV